MSPDPDPDLARRPRTLRVFTDSDMERMRDLYYDRAVPLTKVAAKFGVPVSTFLRWIAEMDWPRRSVQAARENPRRDLFAEAEEQRETERAPRRRKSAGPIDPFGLARDVASAARAELDALKREPAPKDFLSRRRRAAVIDQLSRALARMQRMERAREDRVMELEKATLALARSLKRPKAPPARKRPGAIVQSFGAGGLREW